MPVSHISHPVQRRTDERNTNTHATAKPTLNAGMDRGMTQASALDELTASSSCSGRTSRYL